VDRARVLTDEITTWAAPRGVGLPQGYARRVRTLAALGQGDYEEAYVQAARVNPPGAPSAGVPGRLMVMDLVEAAVRTGRTDRARAHVAAAQQAGIPRISTRAALITAGAAALAADDDEADRLFEAALSLPEADGGRSNRPASNSPTDNGSAAPATPPAPACTCAPRWTPSTGWAPDRGRSGPATNSAPPESPPPPPDPTPARPH
jgi:hypothetical protein